MNTRILYMDDDKLTATLVAVKLRKIGYDVVVAASGEEGLEQYSHGRFELVLCDYAMPGLSGLDVLRVLLDSGAVPPFVFLTGMGDENVAVEVMKHGAADYVVKDANGEYLESLPGVLERALDRKQRVQAHLNALAALRESEKRYRDIFETNPAIKLIIDPEDGALIDCNQAAVDFYGYPREELLSMTIFDINTLSQEEIREIIGQITTRTVLHHQFVHRLKSGDQRHVEVYTGPITLGEKNFIHTIIHDITGIVVAEEQLRASEAKFRQIFERTRDGVCILRTDGAIESWNTGAEKITSISASAVTGRGIAGILFLESAGLSNEHHREDFESDLASVIDGSSQYVERFSEIIFTPDGGVRYVDLSIFPIEAEAEKRICVIMHNVTEQIRHRQELQASEQKFRTLFDSIADAVFILDQTTGNLLEANASACDLYGYEHEEMISMIVLQLSAEPEKTREAMRSPKAFIPLRYHKKKSGEVFSAEITTSAVQMNGRDVIVCTVRDISVRIGLQEELERSVALMEVVNDAVVDAILVTNAGKSILSFNKRFVQNWGVPSVEAFDPSDEETLKSIFHNPPETAKIQESLLAVEETLSDAYGIVEIESGQEYEVHASPFYVRDKVAGTVWSFRNLTQRRHAEEQLQISQARLKAIFDNAAVGIALLNRQGKFIQFNEQLAIMLGYEPSELKQLSKPELSYGDDRQQAEERLAHLFENGDDGYKIEKRFVRKDGNIFWADLSVKPIQNSSGKVEAAISIIADISAKKRFENQLQRMNHDLQSRNEELNAFAQSVAHDLKNPVSVIKGLAELLEADLHEYKPDELYEIISRIKSAGDSMESIIDSLMLLSRVRDEKIDLAPLDMHRPLMDTLQQLERILNLKNAVVKLQESMPGCIGYAPWVQLIWTNYLTNALKYGGPNPMIDVYARQHQAGKVTYYVQDNGPGIAVESIDRLFVPYQRLSETESGHGLGLSIVKRIVERLHGSVGVTNAVPNGAIFYFTLPSEANIIEQRTANGPQ